MTETALRRSFVEAARTFLGCRESDGSHRRIIDIYNQIRPLPRGYKMSYTDPWCAAYVSAVAAQCGLGAVVHAECSCEQMLLRYKADGRFDEPEFAAPKPGDLVLYDWDGDRLSDHVGIIAELDGDKLRVIEGNKSDSVDYRSIHMASRNIRGFCAPDFLSLAEDYQRPASEAAAPGESGSATSPSQPISPSQPTSPSQPAGSGSAELSLPYLRRGAAGITVKALQTLLIGYGFRCGVYGADGEFGSATLGAVQSYQRSHSLGLDGIVGIETWRSLLGLGG